MGFVVIFFGLTMLVNGVGALQHTSEILKAEQELMPQMKNMTERTVRMGGALGLFLGLCLIANAILNTRLLRWYYLNSKQDKEDTR